MFMLNNLTKQQLFACGGLFFVGLNLLGIILSLGGIFYPILILLYAISGLGVLAYLIFINWSNISLSPSFSAVLILSLTYIFLLSNYTTPTIFSGRDQGSFAEAAISLSSNHQLKFSFPAIREFFAIYGPGEALNFPGFHYNPDGYLITQFPLGYISWLASFYSFFGLYGLIVANGITFFIFLLSFYLTTRYFLRPSSAWVSLFIILTSFVFSWFFKFTLSENIALALVWFGILTFLFFLRDKSQLCLFSSLISFSILAFSRLEAFIFLAMILLVLLVKFFDPSYRLSSFFSKKMVFILLLLVPLYLINIHTNFGYFYMVARGLLHSLGGSRGDGTGFFSLVFYNIKLFSVYSLIAYVILGSISIIHLAVKRKWNYLIPFFILLPSVFYLLNPSISLDHPWMLRRYVYSLIPMVIFYSVCFLDHFLERRYLFYLFSLFLLFLNLPVFLSYINVAENKNLLAQTEKISHNFKNTDLVLVDREAGGSGFSMITGPLRSLYGKQAVYFFNPEDLKKINKNRFSNIYFIIPDYKSSFYAESGILEQSSVYKDYTIKNEILLIKTGAKEEIYESPIELPPLESITVSGKIYKLNP